MPNFIEPLEARIAPAVAAVIDLTQLGGGGFKISQDSPGTGDQFGDSLTALGDLNGDGADDFAVAAASGSVSKIYVIFGQADGFPADFKVDSLDGSNGFRIDGAPGDLAGASVRSAGDVNQDGFDDLAIGAPGVGPVGEKTGAAYVVFGHADPFAATLALASLNGTNGFSLIGETGGMETRFSVGTGTDVNNDGFDDIIIGAADIDGGAGAAYVVFGASGGFAASKNLSSLTGGDGFKLPGQGAEHAGAIVSGVGDVNRDGFGDLIIASQIEGVGESTSYVVLGRSGPFGATQNLSALDGTNGFAITGVSNPPSGRSVGPAGDLNGDGFADVVLISAPIHGNSPDGPVDAYVIFGHTGSFSAQVSAADLNVTDGFAIRIAPLGTVPSSGAVDALGDVNGDGFGDLGISFPFATDGPNDVEDALVVFGHGGNFPASIDADTFGPGEGFRIVNAVAANDGRGFPITALSAAGDVNNDGFADVLVGSPAAAAGAAYVVFGKAQFVATSPLGNTAEFVDADGDRVVIKVSKGRLTQDNFDFLPVTAVRAAGASQAFFGLTLDSSFSGAVVKIKTVQAGAGNGFTHCGQIASDDFLRKIKIAGDLDSISVGSGVAGANAIDALIVQNLGPTGGIGQASFLGSVGLLKVRGEMRNIEMTVGGGVSSGLRKMIVNGSITGSHITSSGTLKMSVLGDVANSSFDAAISIRSLTVSGDLVDTTIRAIGDGSTADTAARNAIGKIVVQGSVDHSRILAGYDGNGSVANGHARIGRVTAGADWIASDLVAGVDAGSDGYFGTDDDFAVGGGFTLASRIASIVIGGQLLGTAAAGDTFGFVSEEIGRFKVGGADIILFTPGANNDLAIFTFGPDGDVALHEVNPPV